MERFDFCSFLPIVYIMPDSFFFTIFSSMFSLIEFLFLFGAMNKYLRNTNKKKCCGSESVVEKIQFYLDYLFTAISQNVDPSWKMSSVNMWKTWFKSTVLVYTTKVSVATIKNARKVNSLEADYLKIICSNPGAILRSTLI